MGDEMLAEVCELAFEVAKEGDAPSGMKNYLYLAHRPPRAYSVAQRALEEDAGFRSRVADRATIENVGEAGYLWLHRPDGWERRFAAITSGVEPIDMTASTPGDRPPMPDPPTFIAPIEPTPAPTIDSIEIELSSLRSLVDRLADERQNVRSSVSELEAELETRRAENLAMSTHLSALRTELSEVKANEDSAATERDAAAQKVDELESSISDLETDMGSLNKEVERLTSELASSNAERDAALADLATVSAERDEKAAELSEELAGSGKQVAELTAENAQLTEDNTELASRVVVAEQARVDLESQLGDISGKWQEATLQLAARSKVDDELETAIGERDQLRKQLADVSEQLTRVRSAADANHEQLVAALADVERVAAPVEVSQAPETDDVPIADEADVTDPGEEPAETEAGAEEPAETEASDEDVAEEVATEEVAAEEPPDEDDAVVSGGDEAVVETETVEDSTPDSSPETSDDTEDEAKATEPAATEPGAADSDVSDNGEAPPPASRTQITVPDDLTDEIEIARNVVSTPDVVLLIDGDGAANLGWPHLDVAARRSALVNYLGQLTADTGAAADVLFERTVGGEEALPVSRAVRVRIADLPVSDSPLIPAIVDGYPLEWPIAVVTDEAAISDQAETLQVTHLGNGQLLDLFLYLSSNDD